MLLKVVGGGALMVKNFKLQKMIFRALLIASLVSVSSGFAIPIAGAADNDKVLEMVILADESTSMSLIDINSEIDAIVEMVSRRELSGDSVMTRIAVAGFGSGVNAVDEKCSMRQVETSNVNEFKDCITKIKRRSGSGVDTDFASAFEYAAETFRSTNTTNPSRAVILLTDGKYDPNGKRGNEQPTSSEVAKLNDATDALRGLRAQIWPIGFGKVIEEELQALARSGASSECNSAQQPYAIIGEEGLKSEYLLEILGATLCVNIEPPKVTPFDLEVHPFTNNVVITIRGAVSDPEVKTKGDGKSLCDDAWVSAEDDSLACEVSVGAEDVGVWTVSSDAGATAETSLSGEISIKFQSCAVSEAVIEIQRSSLDGNSEVKWLTGGGINYPQATISAGDAEVGFTADAAVKKVDLSGLVLTETDTLLVSLSGKQGDFVWLTAISDSCQIGAVSNSDPQQGGESTGNGEITDPPEPKFPWFMMLIALALIGFVAWMFKRRSASGKFPIGADLKQRVSSQGSDAQWSSRVDLGGRKKVGISYGANGWVNESESGTPDFFVAPSRKKSLGDFVLTIPARNDLENGQGNEGSESFQTYVLETDRNSGVPIRGGSIRIEVPEELEDEEFEDLEN
jgi:hypothetical protein